MKTLADRLRFVMEWHSLSARTWATTAGLSENALNTFFKRAAKAPDAHLRGSTLIALARAANVSSDWLASGEGDPGGVRLGPGDPDPKELVAKLGQAAGVPDDVLAAFRAHRRKDASPLYWMALLLTLSQGSPRIQALPRAKTQ